MALTNAESQKLDATLDACTRAAAATEDLLDVITNNSGRGEDIAAGISTHAAVTGNATRAGHVAVVDSTSGNNDAASGISVSPKGVNAAISEALTDIDAGNIKAGTLGAVRGGTGRTDGMTTDVMLTGYNVSATSVGELGDAPVKNAVDVDTLTVPGVYFCTGTVALHYPLASNFFVRVWRSGNYIYQTAAQIGGGSAFIRQSSNSGASWNSWQPVDYRSTSNIIIYISKDGNDTNTGLTADSPVLTVGAAYRIAMGLNTTNILRFCFGPGDWGNVTIYGTAFSAGAILVTNYTNGTATSDPGNMPRFENLTLSDGVFYIGNVEASTLAIINTQILNQYYFIAGRVALNRFSYFSLTNPCKIKFVSGLTTPCFQAGGQSILYLNSAVELENGLTNGIFLDAYRGAQLYIDNNFSYTGTFSGTKYNFRGDVAIAFHSSKSLDSLPGTGGSGECLLNGIPTGVVDLSSAQTVAGQKTFTISPIVQNTGPVLRLMQTDVIKGTRPSANQTSGIIFYDSQGTSNVNQLGLVQNGVMADGRVYTGIYATKFVADSNVNANVNVFILEDGTAYATAPQLRPINDNARSLGTADTRWSELFAGTATINTSDEREKDNIDALPDEILNAWGEVNFQQYQFKDAIADKGEDKARVHSGVIAQRVMEVFAKHGLDATRYGLLCRDSWEAEDWDETIIDKEAVTETIKVVDKEAVTETVKVVEMDAYTDEDGTEHPAVTREEVYEVSPEESHEETRVVEPEVSHVEHHHKDAGDRYGIRYEEALCLEAAYQRRRADRMEARLAALEAKVK